MEYVLHISILIAIYATLAVSLDLLVGQTGMLSIAQGAFYGLGAYGSALIAVHLGASFPLSLCASMAVAAVFSLAISLPSMRLRGDYFVIATFGFQMILLSVLTNWMNLTRGPLGISNIPQPVILGLHVESHIEFLILAAFIAAWAYLVIWLIASSPFGRVLRAIREDEVLAQSLGKNILRFKVTAFAVSSSVAASAGSLYAHYATYIDPTSFTVMESILILAMVIIGGAGSLRGSFVGAVALVVLPELLRFAGLSNSAAANVRQMVYGTLLVIMMMVRPQGLVGGFRFAKGNRTIQ